MTMDKAKRADELRRRLLVLADSADVFRKMAQAMTMGEMSTAVKMLTSDVEPDVIAACASQLVMISAEFDCNATADISFMMIRLASSRAKSARAAAMVMSSAARQMGAVS